MLAGSTLDRRFGLFWKGWKQRPPAGWPLCRRPNSILGLYPVVDSVKYWCQPAGAGVKTIQLRIKNLPAAQVAPAIA